MGGTLPLIYSLVGDLFDVKKRAPVAAAIQVATGVGLAAGQAISGFVGKAASQCYTLTGLVAAAIECACQMHDFARPTSKDR